MSNPALSATPRAAGWPALLVATLVYGLSFLWFYPPLSGTEDESGFINQAFAWSRGTVSAEGAGLERLPDFVPVEEGRHVSRRNPGRSLTVLPLIAAGQDRLVFATGALIHIATVLVAGALLAGSGASPLWAVLVLCHPTLSLYSRTVMADELGGLLLLCAVFATLAKETRPWAAGIALGLAVVARYQAAIAVPFVLLVLARERGARAALKAALAAGAIAGALFVYDVFLYGRALGAIGMVAGKSTVGGAPGGAPLFSPRYVAPNLMFYSVTLLLLWPLQLISLAADVGPVRRYACAIGLPVLGLLTCYFFRDSGGDALQDLVLGQRLLQLALPVWIVCYALALRKAFAAAGTRWPVPFAGVAATSAVLAACAALLAAQAWMFERHQERLHRLFEAKQQIAAEIPPGSLIYANQVLHKLFWTYPDCSLFHWREIGSDREELSCRPGTPSNGNRYVAFLAKNPGEAPPAEVRALISRSPAARLPVAESGLVLYRLGP